MSSFSDRLRPVVVPTLSPDPREKFGYVKKKIPAGAGGTKRHLQRYGDNLVCVRYRVDETRGVQLTTVEIVVDERPISQAKVDFPDDAVVLVRIGFVETDLRLDARAAGGRWNPEARAWELTWGAVRELNLVDRVILENGQM